MATNTHVPVFRLLRLWRHVRIRFSRICQGFQYPGPTTCQSGLCGQKFSSPAVPFRQNIGKLYPGKMIFISGVPDAKCPRFSINLKSEKINAFHFDVRFDFSKDKEVITRNARLDGSWGKAERELSKPFPFGQDKFFEVIILVEQNGYKVAVNNEHLLEFEHRFPLEKVDFLVIRGDLRVSNVRIQG